MAFSLAADRSLGYNLDKEIGIYLVSIRPRSQLQNTETGLYYLQSRYYDPEIGRFINADAFAATGQGILGHNMFAYCGNNPIMRIDPTGNDYCAIDLSETADGGFFSFALTIPAVGIGSGVSELWDEFVDKVTKSLSKADPTKIYRSDTEEHHIAAKHRGESHFCLCRAEYACEHNCKN